MLLLMQFHSHCHTSKRQSRSSDCCAAAARRSVPAIKETAKSHFRGSSKRCFEVIPAQSNILEDFLMSYYDGDVGNFGLRSRLAVDNIFLDFVDFDLWDEDRDD